MNTREALKQKFGCKDEDLVRPLPVATEWSKPFWEGTRQRKLLLKRCKSCGHIDHPPYLYCTACSSEECEWIEASGKATLYAYTVNNYGVPFAFIEDLPYVVALVDLAEGPRMISNIVCADPEELQNGMELEVVFEEMTPEIILPKWKPVND